MEGSAERIEQKRTLAAAQLRWKRGMRMRMNLTDDAHDAMAAMKKDGRRKKIRLRRQMKVTGLGCGVTRLQGGESIWPFKRGGCLVAEDEMGTRRTTERAFPWTGSREVGKRQCGRWARAFFRRSLAPGC